MDRRRVEFCTVEKDARGRNRPGRDGPSLFTTDIPDVFDADSLDKMIQRGELRVRPAEKAEPKPDDSKKKDGNAKKKGKTKKNGKKKGGKRSRKKVGKEKG